MPFKVKVVHKIPWSKMATHFGYFSVSLPEKIPWIKKPGGRQSMELQREFDTTEQAQNTTTQGKDCTLCADLTVFYLLMPST